MTLPAVQNQQGVLDLLGVPTLDLNDVPRRLADLPTDLLLQGLRETGETFKAQSERWRTQVGFVLRELRSRYDDGDYGDYIEAFAASTGFAEKTLWSWRKRIEDTYGKASTKGRRDKGLSAGPKGEVRDSRTSGQHERDPDTPEEASDADESEVEPPEDDISGIGEDQAEVIDDQPDSEPPAFAPTAAAVVDAVLAVPVADLGTLDPDRLQEAMSWIREGWKVATRATPRSRSRAAVVKPKDCHHPQNRRLGDNCAECGAKVKGR